MFRRPCLRTFASKRLILEDISQRTALLQINRPDSLNALNSEVVKELLMSLERVERDSGIHAVILTGDKKAFAGTSHLPLSVF
jgi:enoyl-CoA hydratase/carnithine racemase